MQTQNLNIDLFIGKKIGFKRKTLQMSQKKLGQHLGVSFQQIQKYQKGLNRLSAGRLKEISEILNVPVSFFYTDIIKKKNTPYHYDEIASSKEEHCSWLPPHISQDANRSSNRLINNPPS
ncbi:helix-turn-helix domain-containing protein [Bartonella rattimassiliensis]|uniref:HTH cro/C1-type domain-containing protein n=1 Tax=Bartonella rattimassiliensis 15908 TaxID=1094556 RepID=J1JK01_9HYPH|nr:helix-turn-helix transcriptional regulator [Bartonella rattimassiliensis]EJF84977.1 hypothetical protein MCY_01360 [Bartonella rattimassiliensis 15908]